MEILLNIRVIGLVINSYFAREQWFKLKKIERLIDMRNMNSTFNKKRQIEHTMEVNIFLQRA